MVYPNQLENLGKLVISEISSAETADWNTDVFPSLRSAWKVLLEQNKFLLEKDANERSLTHQFAFYLQHCFPYWHVDCEYNRVGESEESKKVWKPNVDEITIPDSKPDSDIAVTVYPDICIHRRGKTHENDNLLVIELKKESNLQQNWDLEKLRAYVQDGYRNKFAYKFGLFLQSARNGEIKTALYRTASESEVPIPGSEWQ